MPRKGVILAVDPGISTGVAVLDRHSIKLVSTGGLATNTLDKKEDLFALIMRVDPELIICETFQTGGRISRDGLATVRLVGAVEALSYVLGSRFVGKLPVTRKACIPQAKKWLQEVQPAHTQHQIDALAHLLSWEENERSK